MCVHVQVAEDEEQSESSESEPGSPGIDPLVFSREDFDTGTVQYCITAALPCTVCPS